MIKEEKEELINRSSFIKKMVSYADERHPKGGIFKTQISMIELLELLYNFPTVQSKQAVWIWDEVRRRWVCSSCSMGCLNNSFNAPMASRCCPYCGSRMMTKD